MRQPQRGPRSLATEGMQEGQYWLDLQHETQYLDDKQYTSLNDDSVEIIKMLIAAIKKLKE